VPALRAQLHKLLSTTVSVIADTSRLPEGASFRGLSSSGFRIGKDHALDFDKGTIVLQLSADFFAELTESPVPLDLNILRALRAPLEMDLYAWLTYRSVRSQRLNRPESISWKYLMQMFGSDYGQIRQFRAAFLAGLAHVLRLYPAARVEATATALKLLPYPPSVPRAVPRRALPPALPE
jgi:hypothetical protein